MMMGIATAAVLLCSNVVISLVKTSARQSKDSAFIVIIASFVTVLQLVVNVAASLNASLGIFIPDCG